jgi:AcrR family transcriptional regulator
VVAVRLPAAERRRQLLDVALATFAATGFHDTSMNDLAEAAGVTKPVLYQHFPSKRDLYLELLEDVSARLCDNIVRQVDQAQGHEGRLAAGLTAYFSFVEEERSAFALLFGRGAPREAEFVKAVRGTERRIGATIAELLGDELGPERGSYVARGILGLAEGTVRHWLRDPDGPSAEQLGRDTAALLFSGLASISRPAPPAP